MEILYSNFSIRAKIDLVLSTPKPGERRVVIVAYISRSEFFPHPDELEIICNPEPGATSISAINELIGRGAIVRFCNDVHMKVYWSSRNGCVITSANASINALGTGKQREAGVCLEPGVVDIERYLEGLNIRDVSDDDLGKLDIETRRPRQRSAEEKQSKHLYMDWYTGKYRTSWKYAWYEDIGEDYPEVIKEASQKSHGVHEPFDCIEVYGDTVTEYDWLLAFKIADGKIDKRSIEWRFVDVVIDDQANNISYAVQIYGTMSLYPEPPFFIDGKFRSALSGVIASLGITKITENPTQILSKKVKSRMANRLR